MQTIFYWTEILVSSPLWKTSYSLSGYFSYETSLTATLPNAKEFVAVMDKSALVLVGYVETVLKKGTVAERRAMKFAVSSVYAAYSSRQKPYRDNKGGRRGPTRRAPE